MKTKQTILLFLSLVLISLLLTQVSAQTNNEKYQTVINQGNEYDLPVGKVYIKNDPIVFEGKQMNITVVIKINSSFDKDSEKQIYLRNKPLETKRTMKAGNTEKNETYLMVNWQSRLWTKKDLKIQILSANKSIFEKEINYTFKPVEVKKTEILSESEKIIQPTKNNLSEIQTELKKKQINYDNLLLKQLIEQATKENKITKKIIYEKEILENNESRIITRTQIQIEPLSNKKTNLTLIVIIPKEVVPEANLIKTKPSAEVLKKDPMIMWHITGKTNKTVEYTIPKNTSVTGNTILFSNEKPSSKTSWKIIPPLLLIPLVAVLIIFFARYEPKANQKD